MRIEGETLTVANIGRLNRKSLPAVAVAKLTVVPPTTRRGIMPLRAYDEPRKSAERPEQKRPHPPTGAGYRDVAPTGFEPVLPP